MNGTAFQMPESIEVEESSYSDTYGKFIVQPLERGFGHTLGNALRRVLLSVLPGAAITSIRIDGVLHEFSTIPGVVEDVTDIVMNLKKVRLKLLDKKSEKVRLEFKGEGVFQAGIIQQNNTSFEILNPDLHIATMDDEVDFALEISIQRGRGYVPADENRNPDQPIGTIAIDAIYCPIVNVSYKVENTRVGQRVDYEKLTLEIATDGSITPEDALTHAGKLFKDHIQLFINFDIQQETEEEEEIDEEILRIRKLLLKSVDELELSVRSSNCLKKENICTISDLVSKDEKEMLEFKNFGRKSLLELTRLIQEKGMEWGMDVEKYLTPQRIKVAD